MGIVTSRHGVSMAEVPRGCAGLPGDDLFAGQIVAVRQVAKPTADPAVASAIQSSSLESGPSGDGQPSSEDPPMRRVSMLMNGAHVGILMLENLEIEVTIEPLDLDTPMDATVFRILATEGRSLLLTRTAIDPSARAADGG